MNGRIYDPTLGRFLQADPFIQAPLNSQNYNRYSYVLNNPMSYTDPSGYFFKKLLRKIAEVPILNMAIQAVLAVYCQACLVAYNAASTYAVTGSLKAAFASAVVSAASPGGGTWGKIATTAVIGGLASKAQGGKFGHGFWSAGLGAAMGGRIKTGNPFANVIVSAVIGGTISKLTGGKFANGAQTWAFSAAIAQDWGEPSKATIKSNGGNCTAGESCGETKLGSLEGLSAERLMEIRDGLWEVYKDGYEPNSALRSISKINRKLSSLVGTQVMDVNLILQSSLYSVAYGMYSQGNAVLSDVGFVAGMCPTKQCEFISGAAAYGQFAIYGDSSGLVGVYSGGFAQKGFQSLVSPFTKNEWLNSIFGGSISGLTSEEAGRD